MTEVITLKDLEERAEHTGFSDEQKRILVAARLVLLHPQIPAPDLSYGRIGWATTSLSQMRAIRMAIGGKWAKAKDWLYSDRVCLEQYVDAADGDTVRLLLIPPSGVCEKVKVGTETVKVKRVVTPAVEEEIEEVRDVFETKCPDSLLALADDDD